MDLRQEIYELKKKISQKLNMYFKNKHLKDQLQ